MEHHDAADTRACHGVAERSRVAERNGQSTIAERPAGNQCIGCGACGACEGGDGFPGDCCPVTGDWVGAPSDEPDRPAARRTDAQARHGGQAGTSPTPADTDACPGALQVPPCLDAPGRVERADHDRTVHAGIHRQQS